MTLSLSLVRPLRSTAIARRSDLDALMCKVARGDEKAFTALCEIVLPAVYGLAIRVVGDDTVAEEVTQQVLLELWRTASRCRPVRGSAISCVMSIAHRRAVDAVRNEPSARHREQPKAVASGTSYDAGGAAASSSFERQRVRRCLASLTELQREAVTLAYYGGYTYLEVAALLEVNPKMVKTRMRDGLMRLRDCFGIE